MYKDLIDDLIYFMDKYGDGPQFQLMKSSTIIFLETRHG